MLNKRGQTAVEYAVLLAVLVAAFAGMQVYLKRGAMGKLRSSADQMGEQYAPQHTTSHFTTTTHSNTITTSKLPDKVKIGGEFWVEPRGEKKIERFCRCDIEVKIFGVGGAIEGFIEKTTRDSYEKAARFTNQFIRDKGL